jgi:uncharacterized membrane-anchored protein
MLAASALGTNLGDFNVDRLGGQGSFLVFAALSAAAIATTAWRGAGYWVAIIVLRAAATNVGDAITHDWRLGFVLPSVVLMALTLAAGAVTREAEGRPVIDARYWLAMLIAGVFGTIAGDLASHTLGLERAALLLTLLTAAAVAARAQRAGGMMAYWIVVLAERCAGTSLGDSAAFGKDIRLGLPAAMLCFGAILCAALLGTLSARPRIAEPGAQA